MGILSVMWIKYCVRYAITFFFRLIFLQWLNLYWKTISCFWKIDLSLNFLNILHGCAVLLWPGRKKKFTLILGPSRDPRSSFSSYLLVQSLLHGVNEWGDVFSGLPFSRHSGDARLRLFKWPCSIILSAKIMPKSVRQRMLQTQLPNSLCVGTDPELFSEKTLGPACSKSLQRWMDF